MSMATGGTGPYTVASLPANCSSTVLMYPALPIALLLRTKTKPLVSVNHSRKPAELEGEKCSFEMDLAVDSG